MLGLVPEMELKTEPGTGSDSQNRRRSPTWSRWGCVTSHPHIHLLSATQISDVAHFNVGLGDKIGNPDGSDNWKAFLNATNTGVTSEGGEGTPGIMLDALEFAACHRNFPAQTPATNKRFANFHRRSLARSRARSGAPCLALSQRRS